MKIYEDQIIGELVSKDYRTASVFKKFKIDFCCNGNRTIADACSKNNTDIDKILYEIELAMKMQDERNIDYNSWPIDLLADYIEKRHHRYVVTKTAEIKPFLDKVCRVHGERHHELIEIKENFNTTANELEKHMKKEELILFPYIRKLVKNEIQNTKLELPAFGTIINPINMMMEEHSAEGERLGNIAILSNDYTAPQDACTTYKVTFALLKEFEEDLHTHIHLENNILFPKAIAMEMEMQDKL